MSKVAIVTGGNKGVGFAIVRGLCKKFEGDVYLTARDEERGQAAVAALNKEGLSPKFHQLDITDGESIVRLQTFMKEKYGGVDVLVNNAGIAFKNAATESFAEQAEVSLKTNFFGTLAMSKNFLPITKPGARVVHVSSMVGASTFRRCSDELKQRVRAIKSLDEVSQLMTSFVEAAKAGTHKEAGWPQTAYGVSKLGVTMMTPIQQGKIGGIKEDVVVNCCCPGYVNTDMSSHKGPLTIDEGAVTPLYLALLPPKVDEPKGKYLSECKVVDWTAA